MTPTQDPNFILIFDVATMSRTPQRIAMFAAAFTLLALATWVWRYMHEKPADGLVTMLAVGATLLWLVAAGTEYEKRLITRKQPLVVEGPVQNLWEDRTVRNAAKRDYTDWQGFRIGEVAFSYVRNTDQNYFNNAGDERIELVEGMRLRVHYLEAQKEDGVKRHIVRVERMIASSQAQ